MSNSAMAIIVSNIVLPLEDSNKLTTFSKFLVALFPVFTKGDLKKMTANMTAAEKDVFIKKINQATLRNNHGIQLQWAIELPTLLHGLMASVFESSMRKFGKNVDLFSASNIDSILAELDNATRIMKFITKYVYAGGKLSKVPSFLKYIPEEDFKTTSLLESNKVVLEALKSKPKSRSKSKAEPRPPTKAEASESKDDNTSHSEECVLCCETFGSGSTSEIKVTLACKHSLGHFCLHRWYLANRGTGTSCPLCRKSLQQDRLILRLSRDLATYMPIGTALDFKKRLRLSYARLRTEAAKQARIAEAVIESRNCIAHRISRRRMEPEIYNACVQMLTKFADKVTESARADLTYVGMIPVVGKESRFVEGQEVIPVQTIGIQEEEADVEAEDDESEENEDEGEESEQDESGDDESQENEDFHDASERVN